MKYNFFQKLYLKFQLFLINKDVNNIKYIISPCLEVQLKAVKQNRYSIQWIKNPCLEIQLETINKCNFKYNLDYIKQYITNQEALEYWKLKYLLLDK
jgi:hypothetical protein